MSTKSASDIKTIPATPTTISLIPIYIPSKMLVSMEKMIELWPRSFYLLSGCDQCESSIV